MATSPGDAVDGDAKRPSDQLGARLRALRLRSGMSLREVARQLGVSPSFVSQIETSKSQPSVATLYSLARLLGTSIDALFSQGVSELADPAGTASPPAGPAGVEPAAARTTPVRAADPVTGPAAASDADGVPMTDGSTAMSRSALGVPAKAFGRGEGRARLSVTRPHERPRIVMDSAVVWEQLAGNTGQDLDFIEIIYPPHGSSTTDNRMLQHAGFEYGYLLEGELEITVGFDTFTLRAGDSVGFDSAVPHLFRNNGSTPARGIWVVRHANG